MAAHNDWINPLVHAATGAANRPGGCTHREQLYSYHVAVHAINVSEESCNFIK